MRACASRVDLVAWFCRYVDAYSWGGSGLVVVVVVRVSLLRWFNGAIGSLAVWQSDSFIW